MRHLVLSMDTRESIHRAGYYNKDVVSLVASAKMEERDVTTTGDNSVRGDNATVGASGGDLTEEELRAVVAEFERQEREAAEAAASSQGEVVPSVAAAAAPSAPISIYEELLRFHEEYGDAPPSPPRQQREQSDGQNSSSEDDRKPAAELNGIYRQPLSRRIFKEKMPGATQGQETAETTEELVCATQSGNSKSSDPNNSEGGSLSLYEELRRQASEMRKEALAESAALRCQAEADEELARNLQKNINISGSRGGSASSGVQQQPHHRADESLDDEAAELFRELSGAPTDGDEERGHSTKRRTDDNSSRPSADPTELDRDIEQQRQILETFERQKELRELERAIQISRKDRPMTKKQLAEDWALLRPARRLQVQQQQGQPVSEPHEPTTYQDERHQHGSRRSARMAETDVHQIQGETRYSVNRESPAERDQRRVPARVLDPYNQYRSHMQRPNDSGNTTEPRSGSQHRELYYPESSRQNLMVRGQPVSTERVGYGEIYYADREQRESRVPSGEDHHSRTSRGAPGRRNYYQEPSEPGDVVTGREQVQYDRQLRRDGRDPSRGDGYGQYGHGQVPHAVPVETMDPQGRRQPVISADQAERRRARRPVHPDDYDSGPPQPDEYTHSSLRSPRRTPPARRELTPPRRHNEICNPDTGSLENDSRRHPAMRGGVQYADMGDDENGSMDQQPSGGLGRSTSDPTNDQTDRDDFLVQGHRETERAVESGEARIVQCVHCSCNLQVPSEYSLVYCPECSLVSPCS